MPDLANVSRTAIFGPESVDAGNETLVRCVWWGVGLLIRWSVKSLYIDPSWISSVKLIIPAACNASKEMVGAFPCLCAAIVSQHVMQNDQGKDPHSRRNSSCIRVAITSMDSGIYIDVTSMSGLSLISINCHVSEISGFQCWLQQYHPISV